MTGLTELTLRDLAERLERKADGADKDQWDGEKYVPSNQAETLRIVAATMVEMADEIRDAAKTKGK